MGSQITIVYEKRSRRRWAAIGFLLIVSLLVISWFVAPSVITWLRSVNREFRIGSGSKVIPPWQLQLAFTLVVFLILGSISALIVTLFAPTKSINVKDKELTASREDNVKYRRKAKKRQRTLNREMREYIQSKDRIKK
jgi:uncharacterized membrane protein SpoIIM required for sporulation